jgi:hypothetical protein
MLTYEEFYTAPDFIHSDADGNINHRGGISLASTQNLDGSHVNVRRGLHPAFHLTH